jgi:hypothetical protein
MSPITDDKKQRGTVSSSTTEVLVYPEYEINNSPRFSMSIQFIPHIPLNYQFSVMRISKRFFLYLLFVFISFLNFS